MSVFWVGLLKIEATLDEELGLSFASFTPQIGKATFVIATPGIEVSIWGQFWIGPEQFEAEKIPRLKGDRKSAGQFSA